MKIITRKKVKKIIELIGYGFIIAPAVIKSGLFDRNYYRRENGLNLPASLALLHYLFIGHWRRLAPSPYLAMEYYLDQIKISDEMRFEPIYHFIRHGWRAGITPNPFFETNRFTDFEAVAGDKYSNPLTYYLQEKAQEISPSPLFDPKFYTKNCPEAAKSAYDPWSHFLYTGKKKGACPCFFLLHWYEFCLGAGRIPFSEKRGEILQTAFFKWLLAVNDHESGNTCLRFDNPYYRNKYLDGGQDVSIVKHYLEAGVFSGSYPRSEVEKLPDKPLISVLVPVYNVEESFLNQCIRSVLLQSYPHWELCLVDDCSTRPNIRELLTIWSELDRRIKVKFLDNNQGISGAANAAASMATGDYFGFLDNDDELSPEALFYMVKYINKTGADCLYSDEELIDYTGRRASTFHKPDFNLELLYSHNYITHFVLARTEIFHKNCGFDPALDGAQDFDFMLKTSENTKKIVHIPKTLYKWRAVETSTSINHKTKNYADQAGKKALEQALVRQGIKGSVTGAKWNFYYQVKRKLIGQPPVSLICDCRRLENCRPWLDNLLNSIKYPDIDCTVIIPENSSFNDEDCRLVHPDKSMPETYNNLAATSDGEYLIFVDAALDPAEDGWLETLLQYAQTDRIGMVCGRILPAVKDHYRIGLKPDLSNHQPCYFAEYFQLASVHMNGLQWPQDILSSTLDFCMLKKSLWLEMDGLLPTYSSWLFGGLDLSLRLHLAGYRNIYAANAVIKERDEVQEDSMALQEDMAYFKNKWLQSEKIINPYFNLKVLTEFNLKTDEFLRWYGQSNQRQE
ncbi:MAG: hypothetical protein CSB24_01010 [Deltaproteobacteria bacterium]|nr:MAG: hypothetical protein CSB24_01010 [Deltaproteobacteria bacterium]